MRVALYNQMFGLNGQSLSANIIGHWAVHYQKRPERIYKRMGLHNTAGIIGITDSEIAGICEILEGQENELKKLLSELGYNYIFFGEGHKTKKSKLGVKVAIASKLDCRQKDIDGFPVENVLGGGGGIAHCFFPNLKLDVLCVHLANPKRKRTLFNEQMQFLQDRISLLKNKVIVMGDFNTSWGNLVDYFPEFSLASNGIKTCSVTPVFKMLKYKDLDHIFVKGFDVSCTESLEGSSDHKLIYTDLK